MAAPGAVSSVQASGGVDALIAAANLLLRGEQSLPSQLLARCNRSREGKRPTKRPTFRPTQKHAASDAFDLSQFFVHSELYWSASPAPRFSTPLYDFVRFGAPLNAAEPAPTRAPFSVRANDTRLRARMRCVALSGRPHGRPARKARPRTLPPSGNVQLHATLVSTPPSKNHTGIHATKAETV